MSNEVIQVLDLIDRYRKFSFEERTIFMTRFSILFNALMAIGKIFLAFFQGIFFFVAGFVNIFIMIAKLECYIGVKEQDDKKFNEHNLMIGLFLISAGLQYAIYMTRLLFHNVSGSNYGMVLGICIACVSFVELAVAIKGCFNAVGKGHYYRNIKLINLCSALTAIALTEMALMGFASDMDSSFIDGLFGLVVGGIIILIGVFIFVAPKFSILDREHNIYKKNDGQIDDQEFKIELTKSKFYAPYYYEGTIKNKIVDDRIKKGRSPIWQWNIWLLILVFTLSEILIFPYAIGALVNYFKNGALVKKLDHKMMELGYQKIQESEE